MGYLHIENLYKKQTIFLFRECYAMEKIHGTSAHVTFKRDIQEGTTEEPAKRSIIYFSGGEKYDNFVKIFDHEKLLAAFDQFGMTEVTVYGEAYGGKCQGMKDTYGPVLKFVAFDVQIGDHWLDVPKAEKVATDLGFDFVHYVRVPATIEALDIERDKPSTQAMRNGCGNDKTSEGIVARPLQEMRTSAESRVIVKHKRPEWRETTSVRRVEDPEKLAKLADAKAIAWEWVTDMRLQHVLDKMPVEMRTIQNLGNIIQAMVEDVIREGAGEIVDSKEARTAIGARTAQLFKSNLNRNIRSEAE